MINLYPCKNRLLQSGNIPAGALLIFILSGLIQSNVTSIWSGRVIQKEESIIDGAKGRLNSTKQITNTVGKNSTEDREVKQIWEY